MGGNVATFEQFQTDMRSAGHSEDEITRAWTALQNPPREGQGRAGISVVPGAGPVPPGMGLPEPRLGGTAMPGGFVPLDESATTQGNGVARYKQLLRAKEDKDLNDFINSEMKSPSTKMGDPLEPPPPVKQQKPGAVATGLKVTGQQFLQGGQHFVNGLLDAAYAMEPFLGKKTQGYGSEALLGGLTLLMAIPSGVGAGVTQAIDSYIPNMDMTIAIPGSRHIGESSPAGYIRAFLATPSLLLDPKMREALKNNPAAVEDMLNRPMTYKELFENIVAFGSAPFITKVASRTLSRAIGRLTPEPLQIQDAVKGAAPTQQPPVGFTVNPQADVPRTPSSTIAGVNSWTDWVREASAVKETKGIVNPEDIAQRVDSIAQQLSKISEDYTPEALRGEKPSKPSAAEPPVGSTPPEGGAPAAAPVEEAPAEGAAPPTSPVVDLSNSINAAIEAVKKSLTESTEGPPIADVGEVVPKGDRGHIVNIYREVEAAMKTYMGNQAGRIDPALLAHMAVGAVIGGTQGTTPEERLIYAFTGLVGGVLARRLTSNIMGAIRSAPDASRILDPSNPVNAGLKPPVPEYQQTNAAMDAVPARAGINVQRILTNEPPLQRADIRAVQQMSAEAAKNVVDIAQKISDGESFEPGALKQALALARDMYTSTRKIGREVGIKNLPEREAALATKAQLDRLAKEFDPTMSEARLAEAVLDLPDVGLGARLYYAVPDALLQAMYTGQLLGTALVRNGVAMVGTMPMTVMGKGFASMRVWRPNAPPIDSAAQGTMAALEGLYEQIRLARSWDKLGVQAASLGPTKVEVAPRGFNALAEIASDYNFDGLASAMEFMHSMSGVAPDILARTDGMGKAWFGRVFTHWEALEQASKEGRTFDGFWDKYENLKINYDELSPEARIRVAEARDRQTANKKFQGTFMQMLQAGPQDPWLNLGYRLLVAPYVRTPLRLLELNADFTPGINKFSSNYNAAMRAGGSEAELARGQLYAGVAIMSSAAYLAAQGYLTGTAPGDPKDAKAMKDAGMPPLSWWDPLSQKYRSYAGLEPLSTVMATGVNLANGMMQMPEASFSKLLVAYGVAESQAIQQKSYLQAISQMWDVVKTGTTDATWEKAVDYIRLRLASFNPVGSAEIEKLVDPAQRRVLKFDTDNTPEGVLRREVYMLWQQATMGIPGLSSMVDAKKQRNMWTGEEIWNTTWPFNPFTQNAYNGEPFAREVQRLQGAGVEPIDQFIGGRKPAMNAGMSPVTPSPAVRLTDPQLDRLEVLMTQVVKDGHGNLVQSLNHLVQTSLYRKQPDVTKSEMLQARWAEFQSRGEAALLREDRNLKFKVEQASRTNDIQRSPKAGNIVITPR